MSPRSPLGRQQPHSPTWLPDLQPSLACSQQAPGDWTGAAGGQEGHPGSRPDNLHSACPPTPKEAVGRVRHKTAEGRGRVWTPGGSFPSLTDSPSALLVQRAQRRPDGPFLGPRPGGVSTRKAASCHRGDRQGPGAREQRRILWEHQSRFSEMHLSPATRGQGRDVTGHGDPNRPLGTGRHGAKRWRVPSHAPLSGKGHQPRAQVSGREPGGGPREGPCSFPVPSSATSPRSSRPRVPQHRSPHLSADTESQGHSTTGPKSPRR